MGLILPNGPAFAHWSDNLATASSDGVSYGTTIPTNASPHTMGTEVTVLDDLAHDCELLTFTLVGTALGSGSSFQGSALLDLLIDPAGGTSWTTLISSLICGWARNHDITATTSICTAPVMYAFPIWLPAGTAIGARIQGAWTQSGDTSYTPPTPKIALWAAGGNKNPASWWCGQKVQTIGTLDAGNSMVQAHTAGASGAFSSWASLGSTTGARSGALQYAVGGPDTATVTSRVYRYEFGAGSTQIGPCVYKGLSSAEFSVSIYPGAVFCDIPAGTQMQVRGSCGSTSPQALDCAAYLVQ